ncbi:hypothetical protein Aperf_G00000133180 [Anoplocephala perfoliata]
MSSGPSLRLNSGHMIPQIAFGTFQAPKNVVAEAVKKAFDAGYRHIDCAMIYGNEEEVGQAIADSMKKHGLKREEVFVATKLWCDSHDPKNVRKACEESLKKLGLDYLDLYLVHFPCSGYVKKGYEFSFDDHNCLVYEDHKLEDTWSGMEKLIPAGLVKSIGVSNFNKHQLEQILKHCKIVPAVNQIEVNLHWLNTELIEFCLSKNIVVEGYSPFGAPGFVKDQAKPILQLEAVLEVAKKHNVTPAQVIIRHALQRNIVVIAKSVTPDRIRLNYDVLGFELTEKEMTQLNKCGLNKRLFLWYSFSKHPDYPFQDVL